MTEEIVARLRAEAEKERLPVMRKETALLLAETVKKLRPERILEIGTCIGISGLTALSACEGRLTTVEIDPDLAERARENFRKAGFSERAEVIEGDCAECLRYMESNRYDLIILDGPKAHYAELFGTLKPMMRDGGVLFADDVLFGGWVNGKNPVPEKRRMLAEHIREYLTAVCADEDFITSILDIGEGVAISVKK